MKLFNITFILAFISVLGLNAQQMPAKKQSEAVSIVGATAHIGNGKVIEKSLIIFEDGKITKIGDASTAASQAKGMIINAEGKHVYPGFIAPNASLGLVEIDAVKATDDEDEIGEMLPHIRSLIAYNAESQVTETMRPNGVLMGQIAPRGGFISGTSSIVQFDAWNWEDAAIKTDDGLHINWPNTVRRGRWWMGEDPGVKPSKEYQDDINKLKSFFAEAKAYLAGDQKENNLPYLAMETVFTGDKNMYVHVNGEKEMLDVIAFKKDEGLDNLVIVGAYDALNIAEELKENNIPVLTGRPHSLPNQDGDDYDLPYKLAAELTKKGVLVGIEGSGDMERMNSRNLPFYAGTAVAFGLDKEEALKLITSNTAKILGIDGFAGTLEEGKDATLFISEGDALDMRTNKLTDAFIQGRKISLETRQTKLWKRYMQKYERQEASK
ncbi:amidohydrolase family protein [Zunongwangia sp. HRR-M8]|uniref:amidohydrolase family protein n=1 Tax=Zunongwangia sp. HRR-M8 TaxID=3015170 RepID=UPI0022DE385C|nr:amidohydrolase family protein [Zunongwangia sp. HRR-M8]WBL23493.1 amidohydrolase family protein [Zunongwangia sp. HRR-M8]